MSRRRKRQPGRGGGPGPALTGDVINPKTGRPYRLIRGGEQIQLGDMDDEQADHEPVKATFRLGGQTFRVNPDLTELTVVDLLEEAEGIKMNNPRALTMTKTYALEHVHPDDRESFWNLVRKRRMDSAEVMILCWKILDGITANPIGGQSDSSDGQPATSQSSPPDSSTPAADLSDPLSAKRAVFLRHIEKIQNRTDEDGKVLPINAAVAAQLVVTARAQGIELDESPSQAATG